jgi:predicted dehydrogenase
VAKVGEEDEELPVPALPLSGRERPHGDAYYVDEFVRAIREGHRPYANMEDGMEGQRIVEAIRRSGQTGEAVRMAEV